MIMLHLPPPPSANAMFMFERTRRGKRRLCPKYIEWRDRAGWQLKMQLVGIPPVDTRFDVEITVPISRKDADNQIKPILDLLQNCGAIENDANAVSVSIRVEKRTDCCVVLTPRPDMGGVRKRPTPRVARPRTRTMEKML
jgi:Holliday junction resolvase RusA-like endonuclease